MGIKTFLLTNLIFLFLFFSVSYAISISCDPCDVNDCQCSITDCTSGTLDVYTTTDCTFTPTYSFAFSDGTKTWSPPSADSYYLKVLCDDSNISDCTTFDVTSGEDTTPPAFSNPQTNETHSGKPCEFTLTWTDTGKLHPLGQYIFSTNNSGIWKNATLINFTSTPQTVTNITTLNNTEYLVEWKYYASDNSSNWAVSDTYEVNVVTTVPCELHSVNINPDCSSSGCKPGQKIIVNATYSGDCPDPYNDESYIQVNANGTDCYICDQDRDLCEDDLCNITGIIVICEESPCSIGWTIPTTIPLECQGKTVNATYSSLNSGYPCRTGSEKKDEVTPTGSFTFYTTTTTPTTTSPNGNGNGGTTSSTTTTVTTTSQATTTVSGTTTAPGESTTTLPGEENGDFPTYWIILIIIIIAAVGIFVWFKFFRTGVEKKSEFEALKRKWSR